MHMVPNLAGPLGLGTCRNIILVSVLWKMCGVLPSSLTNGLILFMVEVRSGLQLFLELQLCPSPILFRS